MSSRWVIITTWLLLSGAASAHDLYDRDAPEGHVKAVGERTWTHASGKFRVEGSFVALKAGQVQILKHDGDLLDIKLEALSHEDRQWVQNRNDAIVRLNTRPRLMLVTQKRQVAGENRNASEIKKAFEPFADKLKVRWDDQFFYVEANGIPDHPMMVGITSWQQQVPLPQAYTGQNAWRIPLHPVVAKRPISAKNHFLRGAIALASNGIPIFNPLNNRGDDAYLFGELDDYGGHCGRADDYHYHLAPAHLQKTIGKTLPLAYALDGYAIYGYDEPDGSRVKKLDVFNGHTVDGDTYHYHATKTYPYLNGGFHGEVTEIEEQVDPQPRAQPLRPALPPMRGAKITGFTWGMNGKHSLTYEVRGQRSTVNYTVAQNGSVMFEFIGTDGQSTTETYQRRGEGAGGPRGGPGQGNRPPRAGGGGGPGEDGRPPRPEDGPPPGGGDARGGRRPPPPLSEALDTNHDGELSKTEIAKAAASIKSLDRNKDGKITDNELRPPRPGDEDRPPPPPEMVAVDHNKDGVISADEVAASPKALLTLDIDKDGIISREELRPEPQPGAGGLGEMPADAPPGGGRRPARPAEEAAEAPKDDFGSLLVASAAFQPGGKYPAEFTCDGDGISPPIEWDKAPAGTKSFAVSVWHVPPGGGVKSYWVVYNIPASVEGLPKNSRRVGTIGLNDKRQASYDPMCSKGPGVKAYHITVYALSKQLELLARQATRAELLKAMGDAKLAQKTTSFTYERNGQE